MSNDKKNDTELAATVLSGVIGPIAYAILAVLRKSIIAQQGIVEAIKRLVEAVKNENSD